MNRRWFSFVPMLMALAAFADPSVDNLTVKQRWPWSGKVDIDFTLTADGPCDVTLQATYTGCETPIVFTNGVIAKTQVGLHPGAHHIVWDPADSGLAGQSLANFTVTAEAATVASRTYLVLDLIDGSVEYAAEPPAEGGWTADVYKSTKMVFRRIPAGAYKIGNSSDMVKLVQTSNPGRYSPKCPLRDVTVTSDFYMGIFKVTSAQRDAVVNGTQTGTTFTGYRFYYDELRGSYGTDGIDWPKTGYQVKPTSFIGRMRGKMQLDPAYTIDLPTDAMWEVAAHGTSVDTVIANGGTIENTVDEIKTLLVQCGWTQLNISAGDPDAPASYPSNGMKVGLKAPTPWGLYDVYGDLSELVLDICTSGSSDVSNPIAETVDPVGPTSDDATIPEGKTSPRRVLRCCGWGSGFGWAVLSAYRAGASSDANNSARLCIYLNQIKK